MAASACLSPSVFVASLPFPAISQTFFAADERRRKRRQQEQDALARAQKQEQQATVPQPSSAEDAFEQVFL